MSRTKLLPVIVTIVGLTIAAMPSCSGEASESSDEIDIDKFIFFPNTKLKWRSAIHRCKIRGFDPVTINSRDEESQLVKIMARNELVQNGIYWIYDEDDSFEAPNQYTDCVEFSYTPSNGRRRNDGTQPGRYGERSPDQCDKKNSVICQRK